MFGYLSLAIKLCVFADFAFYVISIMETLFI